MTPRTAPLVLLLAALAGCAKKNNASIEMSGICFPPDNCTFAAECSSYLMGNETLDVSIMGPSLSVPIEVHNQLKDNGDKEGTTGQVNTNDATVEQVIVSWSAPGFSMAGVTNDTTQDVPANGVKTLGLELLNYDAAVDLVNGVSGGPSITAVAEVQLKGTLKSGKKFETGVYRVAVDVCDGCLASRFVCDGGKIATGSCLSWGQWPNNVDCGDAPAFPIGGVVSNLVNSGLVVRCNGTDITVASGDTSWTFAGLITGAPYSCAITSQPAPQSCAFDTANNTGTIAGAAVTDINITCTP